MRAPPPNSRHTLHNPLHYPTEADRRVREQQEKVRKELQEKALALQTRKLKNPNELSPDARHMAQLAAAIDEHLYKGPNSIPLDYALKLYNVAENQKLSATERDALNRWFHQNIDLYRPIVVVKSFSDPTPILKFPPIFGVTLRPLPGTMQNDTVLQKFHQDAVDGAFPKFQDAATRSLDTALVESQFSDEENARLMHQAREGTRVLMEALIPYLPDGHPSKKTTTGSNNTSKSGDDFLGSEDDLMD